jgi:endoglucanase
MALRVVGNRLVSGVGRPVQLAGVNRPGTEFSCVQGSGIFDGPNDEPSVRAIADWHVNAVRVPLNEDCWLGINGVPPAFSGQSYRAALTDYVRLLHRYGQVVELSLMWVAPGQQQSTSQLPMPDADHATDFWRSVAVAFRDDPAVFFGAYGEPHDVGWACWRGGGPSCTTPYSAVGMQDLVNAIRSAGAEQPIALPGIDRANDLSSWLDYQPHDQRHSLIAEFHVYNFNACHNLSCWQKTVLPVSRHVPVTTSELGEDDCRGGFLDAYLPFADGNGISYLAWAWNTWGKCSALITTYSGVPTAYGFIYREDLTQRAPSLATPSPAQVVMKPGAGRPTSPLLLTAGGGILLALGLVLWTLVARRRKSQGS